MTVHLIKTLYKESKYRKRATLFPCLTRDRKGTDRIDFQRGLPRAAGSLLPLVSTNGFKYRRQSLFLCGIYPLS